MKDPNLEARSSRRSLLSLLTSTALQGERDKIRVLLYVFIRKRGSCH